MINKIIGSFCFIFYISSSFAEQTSYEECGGDYECRKEKYFTQIPTNFDTLTPEHARIDWTRIDAMMDGVHASEVGNPAYRPLS